MLNDLLKTSPTAKVLVSVSSILMVGLVTYNWAIAPQRSYLHAAQQHESMMQNAGKKSQVIKNRILSKEKEMANLYDQIAETKDSFFTPKIAREFFLDLEPILLQSSCSMESLTSVSPDKIFTDDQAQNHPGVVLRCAQIKFIGRYEHIIKFIKRLSGYSQRISVNNILLEAVEPGSRMLMCNMTITIYLIEDKEKMEDNKKDKKENKETISDE